MRKKEEAIMANFLVVKELDVPGVEINWEIDRSLEKELQYKIATNPFVAIIVASGSKDRRWNYGVRIWKREIIPLFKKKTELFFLLPGEYQIWWKIIWDKRGCSPLLDSFQLRESEDYRVEFAVENPTMSSYHGDMVEINIQQEFFSKSAFQKCWIVWKIRHPFLSRIFGLATATKKETIE
jgi:hypothetical protein